MFSMAPRYIFRCVILLSGLVLFGPNCADIPTEKEAVNSGMPIFQRSGKPIYQTAMEDRHSTVGLPRVSGSTWSRPD